LYQIQYYYKFYDVHTLQKPSAHNVRVWSVMTIIVVRWRVDLVIGGFPCYDCSRYSNCNWKSPKHWPQKYSKRCWTLLASLCVSPYFIPTANIYI